MKDPEREDSVVKILIRMLSGFGVVLFLYLFLPLIILSPDAGIPDSGKSLPSNGSITNRIRHDILFPADRDSGNGVLQKLRNTRLMGRSPARRNSLYDSGTATVAGTYLPEVVPRNSDGLNPCLNPIFQFFRTHACPVRAGPQPLS